jgi:CRP-like cAMP-binding protein
VCAVAKFEPGTVIFSKGGASERLYVVLEGQVEIAMESPSYSVGFVGSGECLGELSLLTHAPHSAGAKARTEVEAAVLERRDLDELVRLRPDIGMQIYKNLAVGVGEKLKRAALLSIRS